jgi:hypothetical protein
LQNQLLASLGGGQYLIRDIPTSKVDVNHLAHRGEGRSRGSKDGPCCLGPALSSIGINEWKDDSGERTPSELSVERYFQATEFALSSTSMVIMGNEGRQDLEVSQPQNSLGLM